MNAATLVTLIGVALLVGALAAYLTVIAFLLYKVNFHLGTILIGVRAIVNQTQPLGAVVNDIVSDVEAIDGALENLVAKADKSAPAERSDTRRSVKSMLKMN